MIRRMMTGVLAAILILVCLAPVRAFGAQENSMVLSSRQVAGEDYTGQIRYYYDGEGRCVREEWEATEEVVTYFYGSNGHLERCDWYRGDVQVQSVDYDDRGNPEDGWVYNRFGWLENRVRYYNHYDQVGRLIEQIKDWSVEGSEQREVYTYEYYDHTLSQGDTVLFGAYEQDADLDNGPEEIRWTVLEVKDGKALLLSTYALESMQYHHINEPISWKKSDIRKWMNGDFYSIAFSEAERQSIDQTPGKDYVFLLNLEELNRYLATNEERICVATPYAVEHNAYVNPETGGSWWLLRSPGTNPRKVISVNSDGKIGQNGDWVACIRGTVRPAVWVDVNALELVDTQESAAVYTAEYTDYYTQDGERIPCCHMITVYDKEGRVLSNTLDLQNGEPIQYVADYSYDAMGNLAKVKESYQSAQERSDRIRVYEYECNDQGQPVKEIRSDYQQSRKGRELTGTWITEYQYDDFGNLLKVTCNGEVLEENTYVPLDQAQWNP